MKKLFAILLAVTMLASMATVVFAAENTTTLTTTVPAASYTLVIPSEQPVEFGATSTELVRPTVTGSAGFAVGKNLKVTVTYDAFKCENTTTTIPFALTVWNDEATSNNYGNFRALPSGNSLVFYGNEDGTVDAYAQETFKFHSNYGPDYDKLAEIDRITLGIESSAWSKALGGEYTATITYSCEVVAG